MSNSILCMSIDVYFFEVQVFVCQMLKTCKIFVKDIHCLLSWDYWLAFVPCTNVMIVPMYIHGFSYI